MDKVLQDKDKALEAAVKNSTPSSAEFHLSSSNPRITKKQKLHFITKNLIPREWLRINQAGVEAMRKRAYFKYQTGSSSIAAVMVDGEPFPVKLTEHIEIIKECLLYMKTESFKLDKQVEAMVTFLCTVHRQIPGFRGQIFHPQLVLLIRVDKELLKKLIKTCDNLNTLMQSK